MFFDGTGKGVKRVDLAKKSTKKSRIDILNESRLLRQQRQEEKRRLAASITIQSCYRSYQCRKKLRSILSMEFDQMIIAVKKWDNEMICKLLRYYINFAYVDTDHVRVYKLCLLLSTSALQKDLSNNYFSLLMNNHYKYRWYSQMSKFVKILLPYINELPTNNNKISKFLMVFWHIFDKVSWSFSNQLSTEQKHDIDFLQCKLFTIHLNRIFYYVKMGLLQSLNMYEDNINTLQYNHSRLLLRIVTLLCSLSYKLHNHNSKLIAFHFIKGIMTIPNLIARLKWGNLSQMMNIISSKSFFATTLQGITKENINCVNNQEKHHDLLKYYDYYKSSIEIENWVDSQNHIIPTFTKYDDIILDQLKNPSLQSQNDVKMDVYDEFSDDDDDDFDDDDYKANEYKEKNVYKRKPIVIPEHSTAYILGNILEFSTDDVHQYLITPLTILIQSLSSYDLQIGLTNILIPSFYTNQIQILHQPKFLNSLCLVANQEEVTIRNLSMFLEKLLVKLPSRQRILYNLVFFTNILRRLWEILNSDTNEMKTNIHNEEYVAMLSLFCKSYNVLLYLQSDQEFRTKEFPLSLNDTGNFILFLKEILYLRYAENINLSLSYVQSLYIHATRTFQLLRDRHSRLKICPSSYWQMNINASKISSEFDSMGESESMRWLREQIPFVMTFEDRVQMVYRKINNERRDDIIVGGKMVRIRRDNVLEDGYESLNNSNLKERIKIQFIDKYGQEEAGVDGGGLFKEFLNLLLKEAFNPDRGLFCYTDDGLLYPNPAARWMTSIEIQLYNFIGRMLGKAIYDNIVIEPQFALFFLKKMLGKQAILNDLSVMDPIFFKNLLLLKDYEGNVEELALTFSVDEETLGINRLINLIPSGSNIPVTNSNRLQFIYQMADFKLNRQIRKQCEAFFKGMQTMIDLSWFKLFEPEELGMLISGSTQIDVHDLRKNVNYANGFKNDHPTIKLFWEVVEEMTDKQRANLLHFITSCSRAPLLGFKSVDPKICIQQSLQSNSLPTAATCFNLMRLPDYPNKEILKEKLLYAIEQCNTGFALS